MNLDVEDEIVALFAAWVRTLTPNQLRAMTWGKTNEMIIKTLKVYA
jgi:hypothetical protein